MRNLDIAVGDICNATLSGRFKKNIIYIFFLLTHSVALHFPTPVPLKDKILHAHRVGDRVAGCGRPVQFSLGSKWMMCEKKKYGYSLKNSFLRGSGFEPSKQQNWKRPWSAPQ